MNINSQKKKFFSIIIPTFNSKYLKRAVKSVVEQEFDDYEILIIDNNSRTDIKEELKNLETSKIKIFKINNDGIIAKSRNKGIKNSIGDYIVFLDSDDWFSKNKLTELKKIINDNKPDIIFHDVYVEYFNGKKKKSRSNINLDDAYNHLLKYGNSLFNSSLCLKKTIIQEIGYIDENKSKVGWEDFDLILRSLKITKNIFKCDKILGNYWVDDTNFSSGKQMITNYKNIIDFYIHGDDFFNNKIPWWLNGPIVKEYIKLKDYNSAKLELKKTKTYRIFEKVKWILFFSYIFFYKK